MLKSCCFKSERGIIELLPNAPALYLISDKGNLQYIGLTKELSRRIYEHNWRGSVPIRKTSLVHWLEGCHDHNLEKFLIYSIRPGYNLGRHNDRNREVCLWEILDGIPTQYEGYYLDRIDFAWSLLDSEDDQLMCKAANGIAYYYDALCLYFPEYRYIRAKWENSRQQILKLYSGRVAAA